MGLTIHYTLKTGLTDPEDVRVLVESLRQSARDLPFKEVGDLVEMQGKDADFQHSDKDDPNRWLKIQAGKYVDDASDRHTSYSVQPLHIIAFSTWPGEGCEEANFGLCRYPAFITPDKRPMRLPTQLNGWRWRSFCKTQYASDPRCGGLQNFLRCHLCVIRMLDLIAKTCLVELEVSDEGGYWQDRDLEKLAREIGDWNELIAAFSGILKDAAGAQDVALESAIAGFPNFEHLEARGRERLQGLRDKMGRNDL